MTIAGTKIRQLPAGQRAQGQKIALPSGKLVSPEVYFIRTGKIPPGLDPALAKRLGTRLLSTKWVQIAETGRARRGKIKMPLPTSRQRLHGGRLPKADVVEIDGQIDFALDVFARHLSKSGKEKVARQVRGLVTTRALSINAALREKTNGNDLRQMWVQGKELLSYLKDHGAMYPAVMQDTTGKVYFARGWTRDKLFRTAPIHEVVHVLQKTGVIRIDVPFAEAIDRLYGLERGLLKVNPNLRKPSAGDFERKPRVEKKDGKVTLYEEPYWSDDVGKRIGQWAFQSLPASQRWEYLYQRCMGKSHAAALESLKARQA